MLCYDAMLG